MDCIWAADKIEETPGFQTYSYLLKDEGMFQPTEYHVMRGLEKDGLLRCVKVLYNGRIKLTFSGGKMRPLDTLCSMMNFASFLSVISTVIDCFMSVRDNGFLKCANLNVSFEQIYIDLETLRPYLHYLPIAVGSEEENTAEDQLRRNLSQQIGALPMYAGSQSEKVRMILTDRSVPLENMRALFQQSVSGDMTSPFLYQENKPNIEPASINSGLRLFSLQPDNPMEFYIDRETRIFGKKTENADCIIPVSTVSRRHCRISFDGKAYYVEDLDSMNGTYLNGQRLPSFRAAKLGKGDVLKLARVEFIVEC